jgi:hypothetical protein
VVRETIHITMRRLSQLPIRAPQSSQYRRDSWCTQMGTTLRTMRSIHIRVSSKKSIKAGMDSPILLPGNIRRAILRAAWLREPPWQVTEREEVGLGQVRSSEKPASSRLTKLEIPVIVISSRNRILFPLCLASRVLNFYQILEAHHPTTTMKGTKSILTHFKSVKSKRNMATDYKAPPRITQHLQSSWEQQVATKWERVRCTEFSEVETLLDNPLLKRSPPTGIRVEAGMKQ